VADGDIEDFFARLPCYYTLRVSTILDDEGRGAFEAGEAGALAMSVILSG